MIQYMRPLEDSVRIAFYPDALSDAPCGFGTDGPFIRPLGWSALYISAATPHAWKSWILFA